MRNMLLAALTFGMALVISVTASAGTFVQGAGFLDIRVGALPQIHLTAQSAGVTLSDAGGGAHAITESASVFQTDTYAVASAAFTGLPNLTGLKLSLHAGAGSFGSSFVSVNPVGTVGISGFGGLETNTGVATPVAGGFEYAISLGNLGSGGMTTVNDVLNNAIVVTGAGFGTGAVNITGVSSNIVFVPALGVTGVAFTLNLTTVQLLSAVEQTVAGVVQEQLTVTLVVGTNNLASVSSTGTIKMVSPFRLSTGGLAGNIAGSITKTFTFVPEPGTVLLLVTGAAGLAIVGRKRMNK